MAILAVGATAFALVGAASAQTAGTAGSSSARASISLKPGSITARDLGARSVQPGHLGLRTVRTIIGAGPVAQRPRATSATVGYLYFAEDVDGGALFRSDGRAWDQLTTGRLGRIARNSIDSSRIRPGGISASRLADRSVTARSMSMDAWRTISTSGLLAARPAATSRPAGSLYFATDSMGGTLFQNDGTSWVAVSSLGAEANISAGGITTALLADGAVTSAKLAAGAVGASALADGAVGTLQLAPGSVDSTRILDGAVGTAKLAPDAVDATRILDGAVGTAKLAPDAVDTSRILDGEVGSADLADGGVELADISPSVWTDRLAAGTLAARPAAAPTNADSLYLATDDAGGTTYRSDGVVWQVAGRTRSPRSIAFMPGIWTNMPAALSEVFGTNRQRVPVDLSTAAQVRLSTNVAVIGSGSLCVHYSTDAGASWSNFDESAGSNCVAGVAQVPVNALGMQVSPWVDVPAAAQSEAAIVRIVSIGGNGALDPNFGVTQLEVR